MPDIDFITEHVFKKKYVGGTDSGVFWKKYYNNKCKNLTFENVKGESVVDDVTASTNNVAKNVKAHKIISEAMIGKVDAIHTTIDTDSLNSLKELLLGRVEIKFAKMSEDVKLPTKRDEDAGLDVYAHFDYDNLTIAPHQTVKIPTGLKSAFSTNYYIKLTEKSGTGSMGIAQRAGVIDAGYRGEWLVPITNTTDKYIVITKDEATVQNKQAYAEALGVGFDDVILHPYSKSICQAIVHLNFKVDSNEVTEEELMSIVSERGTGGFGSTGK